MLISRNESEVSDMTIRKPPIHDSELLAAEMKKSGISILEMVRRSGKTRPTVQRAVRGGRIEYETLTAFACALGKDPSYFLLPMSSKFDGPNPAA